MMKNTEWGAVAYLSHSKYGKNSEIYFNNNNACLTGCGADTTSETGNALCKNLYGSKENNVYNQSTSGNISGIFDMSGGSSEYVMGYNTGAGTIGGSSGITSIYNDFFTNSKWDKYYDKYNNSSTLWKTYNKRILGDATGEMGPFIVSGKPIGSWYSDQAYFVLNSSPWFLRGGDYSNASTSGLFGFAGNYGINSGFSFRVVLTPSN